jgi:hypothetical protein
MKNLFIMHARNDFEDYYEKATFELIFFGQTASVFVLAQSNKFRMPEPICLCPLQELNPCNGLRAKPDRTPSFSRQSARRPNVICGCPAG